MPTPDRTFHALKSSSTCCCQGHGETGSLPGNSEGILSFAAARSTSPHKASSNLVAFPNSPSRMARKTAFLGASGSKDSSCFSGLVRRPPLGCGVVSVCMWSWARLMHYPRSQEAILLRRTFEICPWYFLPPLAQGARTIRMKLCNFK